MLQVKGKVFFVITSFVIKPTLKKIIYLNDIINDEENFFAENKLSDCLIGFREVC